MTGQEFRRDQIAKNYTQEQWNRMYNEAASCSDALTKLWNEMYNNPTHAAVLLYNRMYEAVVSGKELSDPAVKAEVLAWNAA